MINRKNVEHIAKLARLKLTPKELEKMRKELSSILDYIKELKKADTFNVKSLGQFFETKNITREDESAVAINKEKLLKLMPETKNNYLKVKSVF